MLTLYWIGELNGDKKTIRDKDRERIGVVEIQREKSR